MADGLKEIQIEVKWRGVVLSEAKRKNNAYPWILPPSPTNSKVSSLTKRSDSTEAGSSRSGSPSFLVKSRVPTRENSDHVSKPFPTHIKPPVSSRYDTATPRPSLIDLDKENIWPESSSRESHKRMKSSVPALLTFRKKEEFCSQNQSMEVSDATTTAISHPEIDLSVYTRASITHPDYSLPRKDDSTPSYDFSYDRSIGFNKVINISKIDDLASTSGFLTRNDCGITQESRAKSPSYISEGDISLTLDHFWDGVSQLKEDLHMLQVAASASKPSFRTRG